MTSGDLSKVEAWNLQLQAKIMSLTKRLETMSKSEIALAMIAIEYEKWSLADQAADTPALLRKIAEILSSEHISRLYEDVIEAAKEETAAEKHIGLTYTLGNPECPANERLSMARLARIAAVDVLQLEENKNAI